MQGPLQPIPVAPLTAKPPFELAIIGIRADFSGAVWHNGILVETHVGLPSFKELGVSEVGFFEVSPNNNTIYIESSPRQVSFGEVSSTHVSANQISAGQVSVGKVSSSRHGVLEVGTAQVSPTQIGIDQFSAAEIGLAQVAATQVRRPQVESFQVDSTKVPFSSSVPFQQFFRSHNVHLQNTTLWENFFREAFHFASIVKVTDLPTGQLAEAQLTRFDSNGRPVAGTILVDDDANGAGWFIDSTPWESSEFSTQNTAYNLQATEDSAAYGRYDLLTTTLYELGHLAGFIQGYSGFDQHVKDSTFTQGDITAPYLLTVAT